MIAPSRGLALAVSVVVTILLAAPTVLALPARSQAVQTEDADLVLEQEIALPAGEVAWKVLFRTGVADTDPPLVTEAGMLLAGSDPLLLLDEGSGRIERIPSGAALAVEAGRRLRPVALAEGSASLLAVAAGVPDPASTPVPGETYGQVGEPFELTAGRYTMSLWRYELDDSGAMQLRERLAGLDLPTLLHVEEGAVSVPAEDDSGQATVAAGEQARLDPTATVDPGDEPATVVLVTLDAAPDTPGATTAAGQPASNTSQPGGAPPQPTAAATRPTETPESTATVEPTAVPADSDGDGLSDDDELSRGTDPASADSDGDGVFDGFEVGVGLDPLRQDTDGDGVSDYLEVPEEPVQGSGDADGDGLTDGYEGQVTLTNPNDFDSDDDGLGDGDENSRGTNPLVADSDGDGLGDGAEIGYGSSPLSGDTDGEGLSDGFEVGQGTNPASADSDGDGVDDGYETGRGMNPLSGDSDGDGLGDGAEVGTYGTNPLNPDSDADGRSDGYEVDCGQSPSAPTDYSDVVSC